LDIGRPGSCCQEVRRLMVLADNPKMFLPRETREIREGGLHVRHPFHAGAMPASSSASLQIASPPVATRNGLSCLLLELSPVESKSPTSGRIKITHPGGRY